MSQPAISHQSSAAADAFARARQAALDAGCSVVESDGGSLVETAPDGSRRVLRPLEPDQSVQRGARIVIAP